MQPKWEEVAYKRFWYGGYLEEVSHIEVRL